QQRRVCLGCIAGPAAEDQVVGTVVGRLTTARAHMVEGDRLLGDSGAAVGADRAVSVEQPFAVRAVGSARRFAECCRAAIAAYRLLGRGCDVGSAATSRSCHVLPSLRNG